MNSLFDEMITSPLFIAKANENASKYSIVDTQLPYKPCVFVFGGFLASLQLIWAIMPTKRTDDTCVVHKYVKRRHDWLYGAFLTGYAKFEEMNPNHFE